MFRQLLVPMDASPSSEQALPLARRLALATHAAVHLVRVIPVPQPPWALMGAYLPQSAYDVALQADEQVALDQLESARSHLACIGFSVSTATLVGEVGPQLELYERMHEIDLVVLALRHHPGPARLTLGSTGAYLLRHGSAPLLLVNGAADPACLSHAIVPLDGSTVHEAALGVLLALAPAVVQQVSLLRVVQDEGERPEGEQYLAEIADRLAWQGLPVAERRVVVGCPATAIHAMAGAEHVVVMATHAHGTPLHWLPSSVAERVVHERAAAVLLLRTGTPAGARLHVVQGGAGDPDEPPLGESAPAVCER